MTAHDAAVRAVAEASCRVRHPKHQATALDSYCAGCWRVAEVSVAALTTTADVRAEVVAAVNAAEGWYVPEAAHTEEGDPMPGIRVWVLVDAVLAALAGGAK